MNLALCVRNASIRVPMRHIASATSVRLHGHGGHDHDMPAVDIKWFYSKSGETIVTPAGIGLTLLDVAHQYEIDLEGACEGSVACSTCHCVLEPEVFDSLPEACEDEDDMLDQAFALTETSRLGCQVVVTADMENATIEIPGATRNFYVDGHVPKPH
mmetsp:Transcript_8006/g.10026  ORF Transcript_8006/g.10026 Transcript_8006/m.10026 type:complete len:157 (-) Transcript_8006:264-734(-)|eukprot:CAMPEP_0185777674 /NCGR_PEP_ID=MMETSP1174-20130828/90354_1 /TAXON_ID=35687 /ORGANISM="Dictyocha speculum, Strain CCMP1381" /LENGTH=156 /DNA_ID=CAMNT_0028466127 /DNA_START=197 /DNA_END=667 /DNA_ORIENTATION=+